MNQAEYSLVLTKEVSTYHIAKPKMKIFRKLKGEIVFLVEGFRYMGKLTKEFSGTLSL
jgi:hypothetical protein